MRRERLYLLDMVEAADAIGGFLGGVSEAAFLTSDLLRSAVLQKLLILGEAHRLPAAQRIPVPSLYGPTADERGF